MIESLRARLTLWYVSVLAAVLVVVCVMIYVLLARALYNRIDENLRTVTAIAVTSLTNDLAEGQDISDAAKSTAAELVSEQVMFAIHDGEGRLLAEEGRDDDLVLTLPRSPAFRPTNRCCSPWGNRKIPMIGTAWRCGTHAFLLLGRSM